MSNRGSLTRSGRDNHAPFERVRVQRRRLIRQASEPSRRPLVYADFDPRGPTDEYDVQGYQGDGGHEAQVNCELGGRRIHKPLLRVS